MWDDFWKCINLPPELHDSAHANFVAWERLRLYYNGVLAVVTLLAASVTALVVGFHFSTDWYKIGALLAAGVPGAVGANVAFCAGPVVEGYAVKFRMNRGSARLILFTLGVIVSVPIAVLVAAATMAAT